MKYELHTNCKKLLGDLHTPVSLYLKLRDLYPESALLESSDFHGNENSLSYIALCPLAKISIHKGVATVFFPDNTKSSQELSENYSVSGAILNFLNHFVITGESNNHCGFFGYTAYDAIRYMEKSTIPESYINDSGLPDILYLLYKYILVFDHFNDELTIIELLQKDEESQISRLEKIIENRNYPSYSFQSVGEIQSFVSDEEYKNSVRRGIEFCQQGELSQIVLSRRFAQSFQGDDFNVYRSLRNINPSPYLFYFDFGSFRILGSSPETHCKVKNNYISIDPIAGTAYRTGNPIQDKLQAEKLLADPKEHAEHEMLVQLACDELKKNADDVHVDFYKEVQYYSHVMHLVSRVSGTIRNNTHSIHACLDSFPAGTLSGAPKVRALELITELEKHNRGIYGGCIGFIGFNGDLNQAILIRSFISREHVLYYQAGAGVVDLSTEEGELQEVNNKLDALNKAIRQAETLIL